MDERFSKGEINIEDYIRERQRLVSQPPPEPGEAGKEVAELDKEEQEILRLLGEKKTVMEISLNLMKEPDQVRKTVDKLISLGLLSQDLSLTETGVVKVFG